MVEADHPRLSIARQCALVSIAQSTFCREPAPETAVNLDLMRRIEEQFLETPWYGSRQMTRHLRREGHAVGAQTRAASDGEDGSRRDLPAPQDDGSASGTPDLSVFAS